MMASLRALLGFTGVVLVGSVSCAHATDDSVGIGGSGSGGAPPSTSSSTSSTSSKSGTGTTTVTTTGTDATTSSSESSAESTSSSSQSSSSTGGGPGAIFFSEYVEGTSNNKALEIVNTTSASFPLGTCQIDRYQNGSSTAAAPTVVLDSVNLASGQVYVICNTGFAQTSLCDQIDGNISHTGNDAVVLVCGGITEDAFGVVGQDMLWGTSPTISQDATLRRKCSVTTGEKNLTNAFDPATEWDGFAVDTFSGLGTYGCP